MIDLHDLMDERSELPPPTLDRSRLAGVRARIAARRRARLATIGSACAVLIALIGGYALTPHADTTPHPAATPSASPTTEYHAGTRIVEGVKVNFAQPEATFTWTPSSLDIWFWESMSISGGSVVVYFDVSINGKHLSEWGSNGAGMGGTAPDKRQMTETGAKIGVPATVVVKLRGTTEDGQPVELPQDGWTMFKIGEPVPFDSYPFPPRPTAVPTFPQSNVYPLVLRHNAADPSAPRTATLTYQKDNQMEVQLTGPGQVRLLLDGVEFTECTSWDYTERLCHLRLPQRDGIRVGQQVTITVVPVHPPEWWGLWISKWDLTTG